jgi:hypothetical protein
VGFVSQSDGGLVHAIWRSRWTTVLVLATYLALLLRGLCVSLAEFDDRDHVSPADLHIVRTTTRSATLSANAVRASLREQRQYAHVEGNAVLQVRADDFEHGVVLGVLEFHRAAPGDVLRVDLGGDLVHAIDQLASFRVKVTIPVRRGENTIRLWASQSSLRYRFAEFALQPTDGPAAFTQEGTFLPLLETATHRVLLGSGWWWNDSLGSPLRDPDERLLSRRAAYLVLEARQPGRYVVRVPYRWNSPQYPNPQWTLDRAPIVPRVSEAAHVLTAEFEAELTGTHVLGIVLTGRIVSPKELGYNEDARPIAYGVWPGRITLAPVR